MDHVTTDQADAELEELLLDLCHVGTASERLLASWLLKTRAVNHGLKDRIASLESLKDLSKPAADPGCPRCGRQGICGCSTSGSWAFVGGTDLRWLAPVDNPATAPTVTITVLP